MPLYEYRCTACSNRFELLVRGGEAPKCPSCGATALEKQFSVFAVNANGHDHAHERPEACASCSDPSGASGCPYARA